MFQEKLDFLMRLTNTRNSVLGRVIHVDASTISRLRTGMRELPKKQDFVKPMSAYFAKAIKDDYQIKSISEAIIPGQSWPEDESKAKALIYSWLLGKITVQDVAVSRLLSGISQFSFRQTGNDAPVNLIEATAITGGPDDSNGIYIGREGKRAAVTAFLTAVLRSEKATTLLLFSDESMEWLYEDAAFAQLWAQLMARVIAKGNRIRIIHTVSRSLDEMLDAMFKWVPIYMSGAIEPHYSPRLRDGVYHRTLFIAPGQAAVVSSSVSMHTERSLNLLIEDSRALSALEYEFQNYLSQCLPLMSIHKSGDSVEVLRLFNELNSVRGKTVIAHRGLSLATMPEAVANSISNRSGNSSITKLAKEQAKVFEKNVNMFSMLEIISLPDADDISADRIPLPFPDILGKPGYFYTKEEFAQHLRNILDLSEKHDNYHISLSSTLIDNMLISHKEQTGVIVARTGPQPITFAFNEPSITKTFGEYLEKQVDSSQDSVASLHEFLEGLIQGR